MIPNPKYSKNRLAFTSGFQLYGNTAPLTNNRSPLNLEPHERGARILVADDDPVVRSIARKSFELLGYDVIESSDGREAINAARRCCPHIILLDVMMPGMDGFEACERIRAAMACDSTPILMMTALDDVASIQKAYEAGATDFIPKPVNWLILGQRIRYMLKARGLLMEHRRLSRMIDQSSASVVITGREGNIEYVNEAFRRLTGYSEEDVLGQNPRIFKSGRHSARHYEILWKTIASGREWRGEFCNLKKNGEHVWLSMVIMPVRNSNGEITHFAASGLDMSDQKRMERHVDRLTRYDALTGLPNRSLFYERLRNVTKQAGASNGFAAVLTVKLNRYDEVNQSLGTAEAEDLVVQAAQQLNKSVHPGETVARTGPGEFMVLLTHNLEPAGAGANAGMLYLRRALERPFYIGAREVRANVSIGASLYPRDGQSADELMRNSQTALHRTNPPIQPCVFFNPSMRTEAVRRFDLEAELRQAMRNRELEIHYQPQYGLDGRRITGVEALARWRHPVRGMVSPGEFIPAAEEHGLIVPLTEYALEQVCRDIAALGQNGGELRWGINISADHLSVPAMAKTFETIIRQAGADPSRIDLELTESSLMNITNESIGTMLELRDMGMTVSIDDFGTGYSSLGYLKYLPVNRLKIDRSFVRDLPMSQEDRRLTRAIVSMANSLEMTALAEGIENAGQEEYLSSIGCAEAQGFHFAKPMPFADLVPFLRERAPAGRLH